MTDQSPEQAVDESAVEPETITNDLTEQSDVWVADDQTPVAQEDSGITLEDEPDDDSNAPVETADGSLSISSDGTLTADQLHDSDGAQ